MTQISDSLGPKRSPTVFLLDSRIWEVSFTLTVETWCLLYCQSSRLTSDPSRPCSAGVLCIFTVQWNETCVHLCQQKKKKKKIRWRRRKKERKKERRQLRPGCAGYRQLLFSYRSPHRLGGFSNNVGSWCTVVSITWLIPITGKLAVGMKIDVFEKSCWWFRGIFGDTYPHLISLPNPKTRSELVQVNILMEIQFFFSQNRGFVCNCT
jgi:hypothetical protein